MNNYFYTTSKHSKNSGFTMIEILVALLIVSVGLLGLARLQIFGIKNTQSGYARSQVSFLGNDIMERIQQNKDSAIVDGSYNIALTATPTAVNCIGAGSNCDPAAMANFDLGIWKNYLTDFLPNGAGSISSAQAGDNQIFTITIQWFDENQSEASTQSAVFLMRLPRT